MKYEPGAADRKIASVLWWKSETGSGWVVGLFNREGVCFAHRPHDSREGARQCAVAVGEEYGVEVGHTIPYLPGEVNEVTGEDDTFADAVFNCIQDLIAFRGDAHPKSLEEALERSLLIEVRKDGSAPNRPTVDADIVAERLGVSPNMVYKLIRQGKLEGYAVGRRKLIYVDTLDRYRERNAFAKVEPAPAPQEPAPPKPRRKKPAAKTSEVPSRRHLR